jgi:proline dehydrogenase
MATDLNHSGEPMVSEKSSTKNSAPLRFGSLLSTILAPFARRFIAGVTLSDAIKKVETLNSKGFLTTLDHLGESVSSPEEAELAAEQYVVILKALKKEGLDLNVSLKLTQIGLDIDPDLCFRNLAKIVKTAESVGGFVRVDMEGSDVTQATLDIVMRVKENRATPVGSVLQVMLKRTAMDVVDLIGKDTTIRLCKGAYKEPADIAFQDMNDIRKEFISITKRLLTSGSYHGIATHDEKLIERIMYFAREQKIPADSFEFQMLLGIKPSFQRKIIADGWKLRIYVPFGRAWLPYTWRRMRERKENLWFAAKSMFQW